MHSPHFSCLVRVGSALFLSALLTCAHAVELGEVLVRSHRGQPLSADIELIGAGNATQSALASPDVYASANIAMHPVLAVLTITTVTRDGRHFLHLASSKIVNTEFVNMFFDLSENGYQVVRQSTLWLTPDPHPTAPVLAAALTAPAPLPLPGPAAVRAPVVAVPRLPAFVTAPIPSIASTLRLAPSARPAACVQQFNAAQIGTCAALDGKNAALDAQIVELEDKVRLLSVAMHAQAAQRPRIQAIAALPAGAPAHAAAEKSTAATPRLFITIASAVVLSLIGVLAFFLLRQRNTPMKKVSAKAIVEWLAGLKRRLLPGKKAAKRSTVADLGLSRHD